MAVPMFVVFLSTPSARRATTIMQCICSKRTTFLSTPSARRATNRWILNFRGRAISIHALREEGDRTIRPSASLHSNFYPRPPRGGRRDAICKAVCHALFLSTPSARRATCVVTNHFASACISIHALREEGDCYPSLSALQYSTFLSTPSARRATVLLTHILPGVYDFYPRPPRGGRLVA